MIRRRLGYDLLQGLIGVGAPLFSPKPPTLLNPSGIDFEARRHAEVLQRQSVKAYQRTLTKTLAQETAAFSNYAGGVGMTKATMDAILSRLDQNAMDSVRQFEKKIDHDMYFARLSELQSYYQRYNQSLITQYDLKRMQQQEIQNAICGTTRLMAGLTLFSPLNAL